MKCTSIVQYVPWISPIFTSFTLARTQTSPHSDYGSNFVTVIMAKTQRNAYDAAFKLKLIDLAVGKGNRAAALELGLNESIRH